MNKLLEVIGNIYDIRENIECIKKVQMDSRKVEKGDIFFAINNGEKYIEEVLTKGASLVITSNKKWKKNLKILVVENVIESMQIIAKEYRKNLKTKIIGIIGSNGKTTVKDILYSIINSNYSSKKTEGNYNNHIGVPYSILQIEEKDKYAIIEMGMSNFGEIKVLCDIAGLDYSIITNIGDSHLEFMLNRKNVFLEKSVVKNYVKNSHLLFFGDDFYLKSLSGISVGFNKENKHIISEYKLENNGSSFKLDEETYNTNLYGKHNCISSSLGIEMALMLGLSVSQVKKGLKNIKITPMRFEKIEKKGITFINDSYNASPISMKYSLDTFSELKSDKDKIVVLGDMEELGEETINFHLDVIEHALEKNFLKVFLYGEKMEKALNKIKSKSNVVSFQDKSEIKEIIYREFNGKLILIKGSNFNQLWKIIE